MPALFVHTGEQPLTWRQGEDVRAERFRAELERVAMGLPEASHLLNLCNNRYFFMLGFGAAIRRRQITLMPPNMGPEVVSGMAEAYPDCCCLVESPLEGVDLPQIRVEDLLPYPASPIFRVTRRRRLYAPLGLPATPNR
jgi:hypothetical protein